MPQFGRTTRLTGSARSEAGFERGAMNAHDAVDLADGIFENLHDIGATSMTTTFRRESVSSISSTGSVGKEFNPEGRVGSTANQLGGMFDKEGAVGKQFTRSGSIGGTLDELARGKKG